MSKPYYNKDSFCLYQGDCLKVLNSIEDKSIDMIFADPPYFLSSGGISCKSGKQVSVNKGNWDLSMSVDERIKFNRKWIKKCREKLKDNGTIWICGTFHNIYTIGVGLEQEGFSIINNITWQKPNPAPNLACRCFTNSTETILWARKQITHKKKGKHLFNYQAMKLENGGKQMKDVWTFTAPSKQEKMFGKHPTQKPESLLERIIKASTNYGDTILDPFNGSGTTGIACSKLNRKYIGVDISKEYLDITIKRYENLEEAEKWQEILING